MYFHWGRVTHICVGKLTIIGSDNGLSPDRRQAIIWTNAGILLIGPLGTNFSEILIEIQTFFIEENTFENVVCEMLFISSRPQCVNESFCSFYSNYLFKQLNLQEANIDVDSSLRSTRQKAIICSIPY